MTSQPDTTIAALQQRIAELEQQLAEQRGSTQRLQAMFKASPDPIVVYDLQGRVKYLNAAFEHVFGWTLDELRGQRIDFVPDANMPETQDAIKRIFGEVIEHVVAFESRRFTKSGAVLDVNLSAALARDDTGQPTGMIVTLRDVTQQKHDEVERLRLQEEVLGAQAAALAELSTPIIPISDDVLVMPLIGTITTHRLEQILAALLDGIAANNARITILDITGVPIIDTHVASGLLQAARSARLLGTQVLVTGVRPEVAQTLVSLGIDLGAIVTLRSLQDGIAYATA